MKMLFKHGIVPTLTNIMRTIQSYIPYTKYKKYITRTISHTISTLSSTSNVLIKKRKAEASDPEASSSFFQKAIRIKKRKIKHELHFDKCGIKNVGNSCYQNAVIQLLRAVPQLVEHMTNLKEKDGKGGANDCLANIMASMSTSRIVDIQDLAGLVSDQFTSGEQEDAYIFLTSLISKLSEEMAYEEGIDFLPITFEHDDIRREAELNWREEKIFNHSPIDDIFGHQSVCVQKCLICNSIRHSYEYSRILELDVPEVVPSGEIWLKDLLAYTFSSFLLYGENSLDCTQCNKRTISTTQKFINKSPEAFLIRIKRFGACRSFNQITMVKNQIEIGLDDNVSIPEIQDNHNNIRDISYKLNGVLDHHSKHCDFGHYTTRRKHIHDDQWYKYDDAYVLNNPTPLNKLTDTSYILALVRNQKELVSDHN